MKVVERTPRTPANGDARERRTVSLPRALRVQSAWNAPRTSRIGHIQLLLRRSSPKPPSVATLMHPEPMPPIGKPRVARVSTYAPVVGSNVTRSTRPANLPRAGFSATPWRHGDCEGERRRPVLRGERTRGAAALHHGSRR